MKTISKKCLTLLSLSSLLLSACGSISTVKPWEKGILAEPGMTFGSDAQIEAAEDHVYFSKEATSGGRSFAAGGCGCN